MMRKALMTIAQSIASLLVIYEEDVLSDAVDKLLVRDFYIGLTL